MVGQQGKGQRHKDNAVRFDGGSKDQMESIPDAYPFAVCNICNIGRRATDEKQCEDARECTREGTMVRSAAGAHVACSPDMSMLVRIAVMRPPPPGADRACDTN